MPITLRARTVVQREGTEQAAIPIPLPTYAMQKAVPIPQFLGQLAVRMPGAVKTVELARTFPGLQANMSITVANPFYARLRHVVRSTANRVAFRHIQ